MVVSTKLSAEDQHAQLMVITELVSALIKAYEAKKPLNLTKLKHDLSRKHHAPFIPKLVNIIAGIPQEYKAKLLPYLKVKPIRTASGVAVVAVMSKVHHKRKI